MNLKSMVKNWKTSLAGLVPILGALYHAGKSLLDGTPVDLPMLLSMLGIGGGLIVAKDGDVSGK